MRLYGDAALIVGISIRGRASGELFTADFRYTDTWLRRDGNRLWAASHVSRLPWRSVNPGIPVPGLPGSTSNPAKSRWHCSGALVGRLGTLSCTTGANYRCMPCGSGSGCCNARGC